MLDIPRLDGEKGWAKIFTAAGARRVPERAHSGHHQGRRSHRGGTRPDHDVTIAMAFRATTTERALLPRLLEAGDDLDPALRRAALSWSLVALD